MDKAKQNYNVQKWICGLSVVLFIAKLVAWYLTNSLAILSDALESIVNVMAGFIGLFSLYVAAKPSDTDHPYGHGKAEFISAAAEGALIIGAGILILYQTVQSYLQKTVVGELDTGLSLVVATAIVNYVAGFICLRIGRKNNSLALQSSGKHLQIDTYTTIGIVFGLVIILFTKIYWIDKLIALCVGIMVIYNGYRILRKSLAGIMDEADMKLLNQIVVLLDAHRRENWIDIHNFRVIKYGSLLHVDCHLTLPWYFNLKEAQVELDVFSDLIKSQFGDALEMFVHTDDCRPPQSCTICTKMDCKVRQHALKQKLEWTLENILVNKQHSIPG
ncbi:cation diffusion facilitator family transporter [Arachidicoccus sp.]|uniref:cation diffusion facilitator family transporter n=1 Tax=Arachidicoccus sp. TaxID=1872624 RepID=UPI003D24A949